jgi:hypothetical protein
MKNRRWFIVVILIMIVVFSGLYLANGRPQESRVRQLIYEQTVNGTVEKVSDHRVSIKTDAGKTQTFSIDPSKQSKFTTKDLAHGDRIVLSFNPDKQVTNLNKLKE